MRTLPIAIAFLLSGCSLIVDEAEEPSVCFDNQPLGELSLESARSYDSGFTNFAGQRAFAVHNGRGGLVDASGRFFALDLQNPERPALVEDYLDASASNEWRRIEIDGARTILLNEDGLLQLVDRTAPNNDVELELNSFFGNTPSLSVAEDCIYAADGFGTAYILRAGGTRPVQVQNNDVVVDRAGLGLSSLGVVQLQSNGSSCSLRTQGPTQFTFRDQLAAALSDRLWVVNDTSVVAYDADGTQEYSLDIGQPITAVRAAGNLLFISTERDLLVYRHQGSNAEPTAVRTIPLSGRALAVAPLFESDPRWVAVFMAREPIETPAVMVVAIFDVEVTCP